MKKLWLLSTKCAEEEPLGQSTVRDVLDVVHRRQPTPTQHMAADSLRDSCMILSSPGMRQLAVGSIMFGKLRYGVYRHVCQYTATRTALRRPQPPNPRRKSCRCPKGRHCPLPARPVRKFAPTHSVQLFERSVNNPITVLNVTIGPDIALEIVVIATNGRPDLRLWRFFVLRG